MELARRSTLALAGLLGAGLLVTAAQALLSLAAPPVFIRGALADPDTFSLSALQDPDDRALVEVIRARMHDVCMAEKGFPEPPGDDTADVAAYNKASFGDDLGNATGPLPEPRSVRIADGVWAEIATTWTPESCRWRADTYLGENPLVREALRVEMTVLLFQGDQAAQADLADVASRWGKCLGDDDAHAQDLLNTIDNPNRGNPYGGAAGGCLSDAIVEEAMRVRAEHHLSVAADNEKIVAAWVQLVDQETAVARALEVGKAPTRG